MTNKQEDNQEEYKDKDFFLNHELGILVFMIVATTVLIILSEIFIP